MIQRIAKTETTIALDPTHRVDIQAPYLFTAITWSPDGSEIAFGMLKNPAEFRDGVRYVVAVAVTVEHGDYRTFLRPPPTGGAADPRRAPGDDPAMSIEQAHGSGC